MKINFMKDRMIIIREKVVFIITVTHDERQHQREQEKIKSDPNQENQSLPDLEISAN